MTRSRQKLPTPWRKCGRVPTEKPNPVSQISVEATKKGAHVGRLGSVFSEQGQFRKRCCVGVKDQKTGVCLTCQKEQLE